MKIGANSQSWVSGSVMRCWTLRTFDPSEPVDRASREVAPNADLLEDKARRMGLSQGTFVLIELAKIDLYVGIDPFP